MIKCLNCSNPAKYLSYGKGKFWAFCRNGVPERPHDKTYEWDRSELKFENKLINRITLRIMNWMIKG